MRIPTILKTPELVFIAGFPPERAAVPPAGLEFGSVTSILELTVLSRRLPTLWNSPDAPSILTASPVGIPTPPAHAKVEGVRDGSVQLLPPLPNPLRPGVVLPSPAGTAVMGPG